MLRYASTFLSHSSTDAALVHAVAAELGRRGVLAWLDAHELHPGVDLSHALDQAIREQQTLTVFLSEPALRSAWVGDELRIAIERYESGGRNNLILPVYLGDPLTLVKSSPLRRSRWIHADQTRVAQLGIRVAPGATPDAADIARQIAAAVYRAIQSEQAGNVVIHLDQRGSIRRGKPLGIPPNHDKLEGVGLVFRPRPGTAGPTETIVGAEWTQLAAALSQALDDALGGRRWRDGKKLYISGAAQYGLAYLIGRHFDRASDATLYCADRNGIGFSNAGWERNGILRGGNADCVANPASGLPALPSGPMNELVLLVGREDIATWAKPYLDEVMPCIPAAWVPTPTTLDDTEELKRLIADITALLLRARGQGCTTLYLILGLPLTAVPLLAAHLLLVMPRIVLLEYRKDLATTGAALADTYAPLDFPG